MQNAICERQQERTKSRSTGPAERAVSLYMFSIHNIETRDILRIHTHNKTHVHTHNCIQPEQQVGVADGDDTTARSLPAESNYVTCHVGCVFVDYNNRSVIP